MRNPKFEWVEAFNASDMRGAAAKVGMAIAARWNGDGNHPRVTTEWLMDATGYRKRSVEEALRVLRKEGWITQLRQGGRRGGESWSTIYRLTYPNPQSSAPNPQSSVSQPAVDCGLLDLPVRPTPIDPVGIKSVDECDQFGTCPFDTPSECRTWHCAPRLHSVNGATDE